MEAGGTEREDGRELMRRRGWEAATGRGGLGGGRRVKKREEEECERGWRTSSDFSAVAAASERAALLCTSSLMASPVQPWLGSVLYHTAGRVLLPPPPRLSAASLPRAALRRHARLRLTLSLVLSFSFSPRLFISTRLLFLSASGVRGTLLCFAAQHRNSCFLPA